MGILLITGYLSLLTNSLIDPFPMPGQMFLSWDINQYLFLRCDKTQNDKLQ